MKVAKRHKVSFKQTRQKTEVDPIRELRVKIVDLQIDLGIILTIYRNL